MKKTLILLAAAGMAMGETTPLQLQWENNKASLTKDANGNDIAYPNYDGASNTITVAVSLDWQAIMQKNINGEYVLFEIADNSDKNHGMLFYGANPNKYIDAWTNGVDDYNSCEIEVASNWENASKAAIVYTAFVEGNNSFTTFNVYLYLADNDGNLTLMNQVKDYYHGTALEALSTISYNDIVVNNINVYNDIIDPSETLAMAEHVIATIPVPEPTTATLSLMALAALAARRRRK